jgi:catechol 2,3-dioxygenase-like lactoylglutathione lyase family enzyme
MNIHRLDHVHVYSMDPESSVHFYQECFGAEPIGKTHTSYGADMFFVRLGGLALVLAPYPPGTRPGVPSSYTDGTYQDAFGVAHIGLHVEDLTEAVETVRQHGVSVLAEPREHAGLRFAYVGAPDGVIIELLQYGVPWSRWLGAPHSA